MSALWFSAQTRPSTVPYLNKDCSVVQCSYCTHGASFNHFHDMESWSSWLDHFSFAISMHVWLSWEVNVALTWLRTRSFNTVQKYTDPIILCSSETSSCSQVTRLKNNASWATSLKKFWQVCNLTYRIKHCWDFGSYTPLYNVFGLFNLYSENPQDSFNISHFLTPLKLTRLHHRPDPSHFGWIKLQQHPFHPKAEMAIIIWIAENFGRGVRVSK